MRGRGSGPLTLLAFVSLVGTSALAQTGLPAAVSMNSAASAPYKIGSDDQLLILVQDEPEFNDKPIQVDPNGRIYMPMAGEIDVSGLTVEEVRDAVQKKLLPFILQPNVTVRLLEARSQPVSVLGAVTKPGEHQLTGEKTLYQVLSLAGGLSSEAGSTVNITRKKEYGPIPLRAAHDDASGEFSIASVEVKGILDATHPEDNIFVKPHDVIAIPVAERVYIIGYVQKPGAFLLNERASVSVLQALSLAEGLQRTAAGDRARILHHVAGSESRVERPVNLKRILEGKDADIALQPEDILFVPSSAAKQVTSRAIEAVVQAGTGIAVWRF